jgi:hypothetical protein
VKFFAWPPNESPTLPVPTKQRKTSISYVLIKTWKNGKIVKKCLKILKIIE